MDHHLETNQSLWNQWTRIHEKSAFYDVEGFKAGQSSLQPVELHELGSVAGKSLLHLQCHFGMDTLSWARLGADVAGVDFSVAHYLRPGGLFYMVEFHPFAYLLDDDGIRVRHSYFYKAEPDQLQERGSYADPEADFSHPAYFWNHSLSDILNALIGAGLRIEFVHEFPYSTYNCFPFVEERQPGKWWPKVEVPLTFSLRATR